MTLILVYCKTQSRFEVLKTVGHEVLVLDYALHFKLLRNNKVVVDVECRRLIATGLHLQTSVRNRTLMKRKTDLHVLMRVHFGETSRAQRDLLLDVGFVEASKHRK